MTSRARPRYKAAILGLGNIASRYQDDPKRRGIVTHAAAYANHPRCALVAGCDPQASQRKRFAKRWHDVRLYDDATTLLRTEHPELVSICAATSTHTALLNAALRSGARGIFCEKPFAETVAAGQRTAERARKLGIPILVNFSRRWDPMLAHVQRDLRRGRWGALLHAHGYYTGTLENAGCHLIDLIRMLGGEIESVEAAPHASQQGMHGALLLTNGTVAFLHQLHQPSYSLFELDLYCTKGRIRLTEHGFLTEAWQVRSHPRFSGHQALVRTRSPYGVGYREVMQRALQNLLDGIEGKRTLAADAQDGLRALMVQEALLRSARKAGRNISLPRKVL